MKHKNMKIEINDKQPLDGVVKELERLGFEKWCMDCGESAKGILVNMQNVFTDTAWSVEPYDSYLLTTLAELKDM